MPAPNAERLKQLMKYKKTDQADHSSITWRAESLFREHQQSIYKHTDRMFAILMSVQWVAGVAASLWISPKTWAGSSSQTHLHVWAAVFLGNTISLFPVALAIFRPGKASTRHTIAVGQMLMSSLLIHLTGGRIETHFHVFGSLAFLSFYRDWRVLIPATVVVALDHFLRGVFWPQSVYGVLTVSQWRWLEHAGWVIFESVFLVMACLRSTREMRDIATRTAEVEAGEERYRHLFENNPLPAWVYDLETLNFIAVNEAAVRHYQYSREEFLRLTTDDIRQAEDAPLHLRSVSQSDYLRHRKKDGSAIDVELTSHALIFDGRRSELVLANDVTKRKRAETERQIISRIIEGVSTTANVGELFQLIHQAVGELLYAENCFVSLFNHATGLLHFEFFVDEFDQTPEPRLPGRGLTGYVLAKGCPLLLTDEQQRRMAEQGEVEVMGTPSASWLGIPLRTPGETIGVMVVQHYTNRGAYSESDVEFLTSVGGQIALAIERKRAEDKLRASAAKLEQSNRELQDFASVASHDLQEPLRKIQTFGDRLQAKCGPQLGDEGRDYLGRMQNAAGRMRALINDLLTFSRVTTKAQPFAPVDLQEIVRDVVSDLEVRVEQSGGRVEVGELLTIDADSLQMRQLMQNLIGNALKFHRADEAPVVKIHSRVVIPERQPGGGSQGNGACQIFVTDNGIGFDEKYLDRIFTVFQRLHGRSEYEGTGVGLAVCRRIAERHGGAVTAESTPGQGATFIVTLPTKRSNGELV
jgi:PAS domain S-box-containing protein